MNPIKEPHTAFYDLAANRQLTDIWDKLKNGLWKESDFQMFVDNTKIGELNRKDWQPVLPGILPVYPGMIWSDEINNMTEPTFTPTIQPTSLSDFLDAAEHYFAQFEGKHIGVQLSGGVDSSLIIGLLKHFKIPHSLIGKTSNRFEFRTEKHVQEILQKENEQTLLIDYEAYLPYSQASEVPPHQYPNILSLNYASALVMAQESQKMGIEVLLSGSGGDNIFAEPIPDNPLECTWMPKGYFEPWLNDMVYAPYGIHLTSFYSDESVINAVYNLRLGEPEDNSKIWARKYFKDFFPQELVNYTYCADFWGLYVDGMMQNMSHLKQIIQEAYEITQNSFFGSKRSSDLFSQDLLNPKKEMYQELEATIALAIWIVQLQKVI